MASIYQLGVLDFIIIGLSLLISAGIGIYIQFSGKRQKTTEEFLLAGKGMSKFPVIISITVIMLSAFTMLSHPTEIYRYGLQRAMMIVSTIIGTYMAAVIFVPVYFQTKVSTTNEFLELRFGRNTRFIISALFSINMIVFMSVVLYAPALALNAVTNLSLELSIIIVGVVCTFYCSIGGLKAVLWTDVFQAGLMLLCLIVIYVKGINETGGLTSIYEHSLEGQRLEVFNMTMDLTTRYTFLNVFMKGIVSALAYYGTSQIEVQRMLSMPDASKAKSSLIWSNVPVTILLILCYVLGLILYNAFYHCDPVLNSEQTGISKYDQLVPYFIVSRMNGIPGLTGLCIAGIFSGSLSTLSSALNSLSTVTVLDFIKPLCSSNWLTETKTVFVAKALSVVYGITCIFLAFLLSAAESLMQITTVLMSVTEGPVLAVYMCAVLTRRSSEKSIIFGLIIGVAFSCWIGYGSVFSGHVFSTLPLSTDMCENATLISNVTQLCPDIQQCHLAHQLSSNETYSEPFYLYKVSFLWFSTFGCLVTLICIFFATLATGWNENLLPADSPCLSPLTKLWIKRTNEASLHKETINMN